MRRRRHPGADNTCASERRGCTELAGYFGADPKLDMIYIMMEQTQNERSRITPAFKKLVYDAFPPN
jgi:hypothetical protein